MRIVVVGDVLLDEDIDGVTTRLSPDAPVPVVDVSSRTRRAGGAGLVATMLAHDGADVTLVTALSFDDAAFAVRDCLRGVRVVAGDAHAPTPIKARLRAGGHAIARIDDVCGEPPEPEVTARMVAAIRSADAILVADYGRGLAAHPRIRDALEQRRAGVPLVWDPHPRGPAPVPSATLATPNVAEATQAARATSGTAEPERMAVELLARWRCAAVAVTIGDQGQCSAKMPALVRCAHPLSRCRRPIRAALATASRRRRSPPSPKGRGRMRPSRPACGRPASTSALAASRR